MRIINPDTNQLACVYLHRIRDNRVVTDTVCFDDGEGVRVDTEYKVGITGHVDKSESISDNHVRSEQQLRNQYTVFLVAQL